jgi:cobaltochelatase CobS
MAIVQARVPEFNHAQHQRLLRSMVAMATMTREGFVVGDLSTLMSPRTVISWAENTLIFDDHVLAFKLSFLNKCEEDEHPIIAEYFQRCFDEELDDSYLHVVERGAE